MMITTIAIIVTNFHTVTAGLSGESIITIGPVTCACSGSAPDAFVATSRSVATLCFLALVFCRVERPVWKLK
jgi:hypothetical protein